MKISSRGEYGLRALLDLARHYGEGPIPCADVATRQQIPPNYLNQLLITLRMAGLVRSVRGAGGGHFLARPPDQITVLEAVLALEGSTAPIDCIEDGTQEACRLDGLCELRHLWLEVKEATDHILGSRTLADLCQQSAHQTSPE